MAEKLEVYYGLPNEVKFCKICNITNQRPNSSNEYEHKKGSPKKTIQFDSEGVCFACNHKKIQKTAVNWKDREAELLELCDRYRRDDGAYDCLVPGSGGKDSVYASWLLKYKYKMNPLTVTWSPHLYTEVGWKNFQSWIHKGGFDNYLFTPNGKVHRILTQIATRQLFHPFQPFIMGQKTFAPKMAAQFQIPLVFYGEMPGEYGAPISHETKTFSEEECDGFKLHFDDVNPEQLYFGGVRGDEIIKEFGLSKNDLAAYTPLNQEKLQKSGIEFHYLGYYIPWDPQECYYFSVDKIDFEANPVRTEGTYSKYNSLDDRIDGLFYYSSYIKFGCGRAMQDSSQEIRNEKITSEEGKLLIEKFDGEFPKRYIDEILDYLDMSQEEFHEIADSFRSPHLWKKTSEGWKLRHTASKTGVDD